MLSDAKSDQLIPFSFKMNNFLNVFMLETSKWWKNKTWLLQLGIWLLVTNGLVIYLFISGAFTEIAATMNIGFRSELSRFTTDVAIQDQLFIALDMFFTLNFQIIPLGIIVMLQGTIITETENGSLTWLISNPVSRRNVILAKFSSNFVNLTIFSSLIPSLTFVVILFIQTGVLIPIHLILFTLIFNVLLIAFFTSFLILLGIVFNSRIILLVLSFGLAQIGGFINFIEPLYKLFLDYTPMSLGAQSLILVLKGEITNFTPIISTIVLSITMLIAAIWIFDRKEF